MNRRKFGDKSLSKQVAELNKKAVAQNKVVSLDDYRTASRRMETKTILVVDEESSKKKTTESLSQRTQWS
jgi:hypothetical protein